MLGLVSGADVAKRMSAVKVVAGVFGEARVAIGNSVSERLFSVAELNKEHLILMRSYCLRV